MEERSIWYLVFEPYYSMDTHLIVLEMIAVLFGFFSVWYAKKEHIWVFPTGIISTALFVYILWVYSLLGDMLINAYYTALSVYGWWVWTRKDDLNNVVSISRTSPQEKRNSVLFFFITVIFVILVYRYFDKFTSWTAYVDTITTAIFFVGMWLMAKKKIENWIFWIVGDLISIPLYWYKGLIFTSFQYLIFTAIALMGYMEWKRRLDNNLQQ
ncbi:MAG: nicotinamide mononucleotide transporter [Flavobacteriaceae bacterium]|jgi:nicotinamide mononucleotide transporter|nr:nicotinamide mononucleotide transporter [Flavobacteriaceae bacterium]NVJ73198.1 nicotinamide mononucleotide transporter [Flavobacteriaceae bacterium]